MLKRLVLAAVTACGIGPALSAQTISLPKMEKAIEDGDKGRIVALEVDQHGETVYSKRFDGKPKERLTDIKSAGKSLTALAVGIAIDQVKLSVDTKVWPLLGSTPNDPHNDISVRDLLTMSSALDCSDNTPKSPGNEERMYRTANWRDFAMRIPLEKSYQRDENGYGRFSYCTAGVFLLGQVVQEVTGVRFDRYVQQHIFVPLGIQDVKWRTSRDGEIQSGGQIKMRADDLITIGRMVLNKGRVGNRQIVSSAWIEEMLQPHRQTGEYVHYGYLWWFNLVKSPRGYEPSWMMMGNGGNIVSIYREYDAVIVVQARSYNKDYAYRNSFEVMWGVLDALPVPPSETAEN